MRVRAGAGAASFRRRSLACCLEEAEQQIEACARSWMPIRRPVNGVAKRRNCVRPSNVPSVSQALQQLADIEQRKKKPPPKKDTETEEAHAKRTEPRASSTDPEARHEDGRRGFRPAYNVQFVTTTDSQVIVGVEVCNSAASGQLAPMLIKSNNVRKNPRSGSSTAVTRAMRTSNTPDADHGVSPVPKPKDPSRDPHVARSETARPLAAGASAWQCRGQAIYTQRAATAECVTPSRARGCDSLWSEVCASKGGGVVVCAPIT